MKILLVNDDGFKAKGIRVFANKLASKHNVIVAAPKSASSGFSHSLSLGRIIKVKHKVIDNLDYYIISGTPCDCVKYGLLSICPDVDIVISGINDLTNVGTDCVYSGTVNAAFEGGILGKPALAVSMNAPNGYYDDVATFILNNLDYLKSLSNGEFVPTINFENERKENWKGIRFTEVGEKKYNDWYEKCGKGYILKGNLIPPKGDENVDVVANLNGYVSLSISRLTCESIVIENKEEESKKICW